MECNKEEAFRTRDIAQTKMQQNDFAGARKFALKAQQLYPNIDNIIQLLTVCHVHCAAQQKVNGHEMDWYGILQIMQTADDSMIKKQYRKLALLLHPDKNQFPGAEAAFKLIGEAQRLLSDPMKRQTYDAKRRVNIKPPVVRVSTQKTMNQYSGRQPVQNGYRGPFFPQHANVNPQQPPGQPTFGCNTFIALCPFCKIMNSVRALDKFTSVLCHSCKKAFVPSEKLARGNNERKAAFVPKDVPSQSHSNTRMKSEANVHSKNFHTNVTPGATHSKGDMQTGIDLKSKKVDSKRKRKKLNKVSDDIDSDSSSDIDEDEIYSVSEKMGKDLASGTDGDRTCRRSTRQKPKMSYNESLMDDDDDDELLSHSDNGAKVGPAPEIENQGVKLGCVQNDLDHKGFKPPNVAQNECNKTSRLKRREIPYEGGNNRCPNTAPIQSSCAYLGPVFNSFDDIRKEECFKVGQIWALYDDDSSMPRLYGRVKSIDSSNKKVLLTLLERDLNDEVAHKWSDRPLPYSCGTYSNGRTQIMDIGKGFSHQVSWGKGTGQNTFHIYPRQGQTWALFKNWNIDLVSESAYTKTYEYEFVEVLSDYAEPYGVTVSFIGKAKGYASIFCQIDSDQKSFCIPPGEMVRFSHMIPSFQLLGKEREDISSGVFELDPALVPNHLEAVVDLKDQKIFPGNFKPLAESTDDFASSRGFGVGFQENSSGYQDPQSATSSSGKIEVPDPEFFSFDSNKSIDKFEVGQIWAVYSDDELPKYYVEIQSICTSPEFKIETKWLIKCATQGEMIKWHDKAMPFGCGMFMVRGKSKKFTLDTFSHILNPQRSGKKKEFAIFPQKGEVWALYKDWNQEMKFYDSEDFEYEIAEVLNIDDQTVEVLPLHHVSGHITVFRGDADGITFRIPKAELLRFSHQIPSFRLTNELDGSLRGYWELDPLALPLAWFCTN